MGIFMGETDRFLIRTDVEGFWVLQCELVQRDIDQLQKQAEKLQVIINPSMCEMLHSKKLNIRGTFMARPLTKLKHREVQVHSSHMQVSPQVDRME